MIKDFLLEIGLKLPDLVAGFLGGVASVFFMRDIKPWQAVGSVFVGCVTAGYLANIASRVVGFDVGSGGAFIVGLTAMMICQGLMEMARRWNPAKTAVNGNGGA